MPGLVDALWGLDLVTGRMYSVGVDFVLAGPVSLYLQGHSTARDVEPLYLLLISGDPGNVRAARRAAEPLSSPAPWPLEYSAVARGRVVSVEIRGGLRIAVAADPVVRAGGREERLVVSEIARGAPVAIVDGKPVRLAPIGVELALRGETL